MIGAKKKTVILFYFIFVFSQWGGDTSLGVVNGVAPLGVGSTALGLLVGLSFENIVCSLFNA